MIIDFHTHIFPSSIAEKAVSALKASSGYENFSDGSAEGLCFSMARSGVDISVNMPILTKPDNFKKTNDHLLEMKQSFPDILSFAALHPRCDGLESKVAWIKEVGFKGVKLHPFFQNEPINSIATKKLVSLCDGAGLYTMIHPGFDASFPDVYLSEPDMIADLLSETKATKVILAHMGGLCRWADVYDKLAGKDVFFDTSFSLDEMGEDLFLKMVEKHGSKRILFGTDSPWKDQRAYVELLKNSKLSEDQKDDILYKNAVKILNIKV